MPQILMTTQSLSLLHSPVFDVCNAREPRKRNSSFDNDFIDGDTQTHTRTQLLRTFYPMAIRHDDVIHYHHISIDRKTPCIHCTKHLIDKISREQSWNHRNSIDWKGREREEQKSVHTTTSQSNENRCNDNIVYVGLLAIKCGELLFALQCSRFAIVRYWPIGRVFELPPLTANQFSDRYKLNGFFFSLCDSALILERYWSFGYQIKWPLKWAILWSVIATTKISSITVLINFLYRLFIDLLTWESNWPQNVRRNGQDSRTNCRNNAILFGRTTFTIRSKHLINNWKNIYIDKASSMEVIMCFSSQVFWVFIWSTVLMLKSG